MEIDMNEVNALADKIKITALMEHNSYVLALDEVAQKLAIELVKQGKQKQVA